jgi:hypothetical protein
MPRTRAASQPRSALPLATDPLAQAEAVADAILYEGYLLYPYRRSSGKNRVRWQFGVLTARGWIEQQQIPDPGVAGAAESWFQQAECLLEAAPLSPVTVRVRFLRLQRRQLYAADGIAVDHLDIPGDRLLSFDEAVPEQVEVTVEVASILGSCWSTPITRPGERRVEPLTGGGRVERTMWPLSAELRVGAERADAPFPAVRLQLRVENCATGSYETRDGALREALLATHVLIHLEVGRFLSLLDPPAWAAGAVAECVQRHLFPVLAGADDSDNVVLCSPILLYDHPQVAPESPGDLHDAAEIDEILSLRTLTLTDAEKREARATDPRAAAIIDRVESLPPELMAKLHGAVRDLQPAADTVRIAGRIVGKGDAVRLRPRLRGTDAHDMFLSGRTAHVHDVLHDVDGSVYLAVTVDDDPAAELHEWYGRFFHFPPDEVEPA